MKTRRFMCLISAIVVLSLAGNSLASTTYAYAAISKTEHGSANDDDSHSAVGSSTAYAEADCPEDHGTSCASWASTTAKVIVSTGSGMGNIIGESVTPGNNDANPTHLFTNRGSADFDSINARMIGGAAFANAKLYLQGLQLTIVNTGDVLDIQKFDFTLSVNSVNTNLLHTGSVMLFGDGAANSTGDIDLSDINVTSGVKSRRGVEQDRGAHPCQLLRAVSVVGNL